LEKGHKKPLLMNEHSIPLRRFFQLFSRTFSETRVKRSMHGAKGFKQNETDEQITNENTLDTIAAESSLSEFSATAK